MQQSTRPRLGNVVLILVIVAVVAVVLIIMMAILAALFVPAVAKVREAASRTQTNNNLRMCAIAIHNYEMTYKQLPDASGLAMRPPYAKPGEERSMWFHLLPYVEADNLYKGNVHDGVVGAYLAPSDPFITTTDGKLNFAGNIRLFGYATLTPTNANNAVEANSGSPTGRTLASSLAPIMTSGLKLSRIADGTSNVFMLTTRYGECGMAMQPTAYSASPIGTPLVAGGEVPSHGSGAGKGGFFGAGAHDMPADRTSNRATFQVAPKLNQCVADNAVFGHSFSNGGISIALCDATVKSVDPSMSTTTFCRALCPSDGHPLANDWADE
jgi:hypothetical protein